MRAVEINATVDIDEVLKKFANLDDRFQKNINLSAKRAAGKVVREKAASIVRQRHYISGALYRSLSKAKTGIYVTRRRNLQVVAGDMHKATSKIKTGFLSFLNTVTPFEDDDPYYARFVEFGHLGPRPAPAKGFMEEAARSTVNEAFRAYEKAFVKALYKTLAQKR